LRAPSEARCIGLPQLARHRRRCTHARDQPDSLRSPADLGRTHDVRRWLLSHLDPADPAVGLADNPGARHRIAGAERATTAHRLPIVRPRSSTNGVASTFLLAIVEYVAWFNTTCLTRVPRRSSIEREVVVGCAPESGHWSSLCGALGGINYAGERARRAGGRCDPRSRWVATAGPRARPGAARRARTSPAASS
jgi:hypothetical protein